MLCTRGGVPGSPVSDSSVNRPSCPSTLSVAVNQNAQNCMMGGGQGHLQFSMLYCLKLGQTHPWCTLLRPHELLRAGEGGQAGAGLAAPLQQDSSPCAARVGHCAALAQAHPARQASAEAAQGPGCSAHLAGLGRLPEAAYGSAVSGKSCGM